MVAAIVITMVGYSHGIAMIATMVAAMIVAIIVTMIAAMRWLWLLL